MREKGELSTKDHHDLDKFLEEILEDYKNGEVSRDKAIASLAHVIAALDLRNMGEVRAWLKAGRAFTRK